MNFDQIISSLPSKAVHEMPALPFPHVGSGKVREIFDLGENLLIVASDRLSAFDVVLPTGVPGKGIILTQMSLFWFKETEEIVPNHLLPDQEEVLAKDLGLSRDMQLRSMAVRKLRPLPVECVVRGYLAGSGWNSYVESGEVSGHRLPAGLRESERLPLPIFTPSTKATQGHDEPITEEECARILGQERFEEVRRVSLELYALAHNRSRGAGLIVADTKFEFGLDEEGTLYLIDEVLTPDSSRYWPADEYQPGGPQRSYDKQYVRDFLLGCDWDRQPPAPVLPPDVLEGTQERYLEAFRKLVTGR